MCGIIGIVGKAQAAARLVDGLKRMEYRGYDSAGICTVDHGELIRRRAPGKLLNLVGELERHPAPGAVILGRSFPHWPAALDLVRRAHALIGDRIVVGWDVAILEDGPCLVEGNGKPDVDLIQRPHRAGLGNSRLGEIMAFHLKNVMAGDIRNGRRIEDLAKA